MSSEMGEFGALDVENLRSLREVVAGTEHWAKVVSLDRAIALLARTEAGADGVSIWRYRFRNSETGGWHEWRYSDRQPVLNSLVADKTEIQGPFTHPQDASGDAVDWKWQYRFQTVMRFMDNGATREAAERAALIDIAELENAAMQAKEAAE